MTKPPPDDDAVPLEQQLARATERLAEAQRLAGLGFWEWQIETGELYWSENIYRLFGLDPAEHEPTYERFLAAIHEQDRAIVEAAVGAALEGSPYSVEHRVVRPDGTLRHVHERGEVYRDAKGRPRRMVGTV